jgi:hypothetical protein
MLGDNTEKAVARSVGKHRAEGALHFRNSSDINLRYPRCSTRQRRRKQLKRGHSDVERSQQSAIITSVGWRYRNQSTPSHCDTGFQCHSSTSRRFTEWAVKCLRSSSDHASDQSTCVPGEERFDCALQHEVRQIEDIACPPRSSSMSFNVTRPLRDASPNAP